MSTSPSRVAASRQVRLGLAVKIFLPVCFTASVRLDWRGGRVAASRQVRLGLAVKIFLPACFTASVRLDWRGGRFRLQPKQNGGKNGLSTSPSRVAARRQVRLGLAVKIFLPACFTASVRLDCTPSGSAGACSKDIACFTASVRLDWRGADAAKAKWWEKRIVNVS